MATSYTTVHGGAGATTEVISPMVTNYSPDAYVNVNSEQLDTVVIQGINRVFEKTLSESDSATLLNIFKIENFSVDRTLGRNDPTEITSEMVSIREGASVDFKVLIADIIGPSGATDIANDHLDQYLANQLWVAFSNAFGSAISSANIPANALGLTAGIDVAEQGGQSLADPATDFMAAITAEAVTSNTSITGFSVDVITNGVTAAQKLYDAHVADTAKGAIASMYRQIARTKYAAYYYLGEDNSGSAVPLVTSALPLVPGDKLSFVFDIDVHTAAARPGVTTVPEDVPNTGSTDAYGTSQFSLNLANRRVLFKLTMGGAGPTIIGLDTSALSGTATAHVATEGVDFALGATTGDVAGSTL
jgi:hypothetical protein